MAYIETENLSFSYEDDEGNPIPVLHDINLKIEKGEYLAILGRNGSGKSTLAKLLNLILEPSSGKITVNGTEFSPEMSEEDILKVRKSVGMVFQNPDNQLVATVVEEDVAFGPENLGLDPKEIRKRVDEALETVGMSEYATYAPHKLSGGQKQRIAIAGILAMMPDCIIFDESTAMLDPSGRKDVVNTFEKLNRERGITVITITHNMEEAVRADRIIVISDGTVAADDTPKNVFSNVQFMKSLGLSVPQVSELFYELKQQGFDLPDDIIDEEEGVDALLKLKNKNRT
ncbi:MAG: energy-coupling factor transporter ATPase [Clostridia bacterium]|nr:energy-coupling factor transporter ATPase [Clostridia bacterium]